jgi:hypothetical protein
MPWFVVVPLCIVPHKLRNKYQEDLCVERSSDSFHCRDQEKRLSKVEKNLEDRPPVAIVVFQVAVRFNPRTFQPR